MFDFLKPSVPAYRNLKPAEFSEGLRQPDAVVLDVRRPDEFASGHLPKSLNIDVTGPDFAQRTAALDKTKALYVYCRSGARSSTAAKQLTAAGFEKVYNLLGGVLDWPETLVR